MNYPNLNSNDSEVDYRPKGSRAISAVVRRHQDAEPYWGDHGQFDHYDERTPHPAVLTPEQLKQFIRISFVGIIILVTVMFLGGCSTYEHRDGGGYTVRYGSPLSSPSSMASPFDDPLITPRPPHKRVAYKPVVKPHVAHTPPPATAALVEPREQRERGDSHPVLNVGKDDEIPREYRHYVSDRSVRTLRSRMAMCKEQRPGYCVSPNVPHCHGPFCHSHSGGDKRHTH